MTDLRPLMNLMVTSVIGGMLRHLITASLRRALQREPTMFEVMYYEYELWLRELSRGYQERPRIYQTIHELVWG